MKTLSFKLTFYMSLCLMMLFSCSEDSFENSVIDDINEFTSLQTDGHLDNLGFKDGMITFKDDDAVVAFLQNYHTSDHELINQRFEEFNSYDETFRSIKDKYLEKQILDPKFESLVLTDFNNDSQIRQVMPLFPPISGLYSVLNENASLLVDDEIVIYKKDIVYQDTYTTLKSINDKIKTNELEGFKLDHKVVDSIVRKGKEDDCNDRIPNNNRQVQGDLGWNNFNSRWGYFAWANSNYERKQGWWWKDQTYISCSAEVFVDGVAGCNGTFPNCTNPGMRTNSSRLVWAGKYVWPSFDDRRRPEDFDDTVNLLEGEHSATVSFENRIWDLSCDTDERF